MRVRVFLVAIWVLALTWAGLLRVAHADDPRPAESAVRTPERVAEGTSIPLLEPPPSLGELAGQPIRRVEVRSVGKRWQSKLVVRSVRLGEPLSLESARRAMRELMNSGQFANVATEVEAEGDGVVLRLVALPRRLIASIRVTGATFDVRRTLHEAGLKEDDEITEPGLAELTSSIESSYARRGYIDAKVSVDTTETDDPDAVLLLIDIDAGDARTFSQRVFIIEPTFDREVGDLKKEYAVESDDQANEETLARADRELTDLLRKRGFYRADVRHAVRHEKDHSYLYVFLESGPRLVPIFDGNRAYDDDELLTALELDENIDSKPQVLRERLHRFYVERGYYDVELDAVERGDASDAVHYLVFSVRENERVTVARRVFACLPSDQDANDIGDEIDSFLEEELPGDSLAGPDDSITTATFGPTTGTGGRAPARRLNPLTTYAPQTYEKAVAHLRDLYFSQGYLNAQIGPLSVLRQRCTKDSLFGRCEPEPFPSELAASCDTDELGIPLPEPATPHEFMCVPDPARGIACAPELTLRIPIHLGPQTMLYDIAFEGNEKLSSFLLATLAGLDLGKPLSNIEIEAARKRVLDAYRESGHAYAEIQTAIEPSPDRTRARARFVISEREPVIVTGFEIIGATRTDHDLIRGRLALEIGKPYRLSWVRASEERVATLGTFSSVAVSLEDPDVPQRQKRVVITVTEQLPQYLDPRIGFSTGEGVRFAIEYGHRNIAAQAISFRLSLRFSYLFDFMIVDDDFRRNIAPLSVSEQLERRNSAAITFPEVGLGPLISLTLEGLDVRDNQRDFGLTKQAFIPSLTYRPLRQISTTLGLSLELNDVQIFNADTVEDAIRDNRSLENLLRVPDGRTFAVGQRLSMTWDRRDNPFSATQGTFLTSSIEHVNAFPADAAEAADNAVESHFFQLTSRVAGYVRLTRKGMAVAVSVGGGYNFQLNDTSRTYPDRLFYLGGVDSIRSFLTDSVVPEDLAQAILNPEAGEEALKVEDIGIRGGDIEINPRVELRVPLNSTFQIGLFIDAGNLWKDPAQIDIFAMRYGAGSGLRINTPIGPLAFDYGINLDRRPWEDFGAFHFSIGLF